MKLTYKQAVDLLNKIWVAHYDSYDVEQFIKWYEVELEHWKKAWFLNVTNDDPILTAKIAIAHLYEKKNYYELLEKYVENDQSFSK